MSTVVLLQALSTFLLTGLSWFVQVVHYPLFNLVPKSEFSKFHSAHVARTNLLILVLLPIEVVTSAFTAYYGSPGLTHHEWILGFVLTLSICICTATVQMPIHAKLAQEKDDELIRRLVLSHWIRTILWSAHTALLIKVSVSPQA
ncbi:MAG: hypothetical protein EBR01_02150 [Proteobacteria bacterium]|jgi:hypothetical protein|nr:hypothetical protein [Pseudomonadota bacterium]